MAVASSTDQCHQCKEYGHFKRDCPQQVQKSRPKRGKEGKGKQGGGGNYQPKWCSEHNTTKHSDAECNKQKELRDKKAEGASGVGCEPGAAAASWPSQLIEHRECSPGAIVSGTTVSTRADHVRVLLQCSGCFLGRGRLVFCCCRDASGGV